MATKRIYDDTGEEILVNRHLACRHGYHVVVVRAEDGELVGRLICQPGSPCENIPYALNNGEGHVCVPGVEKGYYDIVCAMGLEWFGRQKNMGLWFDEEVEGWGIYQFEEDANHDWFVKPTFDLDSPTKALVAGMRKYHEMARG